MAVGADVVYRGDSAQKAHAVFKREVVHSKAHNGESVFLWDYWRDDDPIREHRLPLLRPGPRLTKIS